MIIFRFSKSIIFLVSTLLFLSCGIRDQENEHKLRNIILVHPTPLSTTTSSTYSGVIEEGANITAAFMAEGKISKISVKEGDRVQKGQLLAVLDDTDYKIGVSQLEAQFNQMTKEKVRMDAMFEKNNISPSDYEKFSTGYEQLMLQLDMAHRKLGYTRLYAPSSGYIASKYMNEGELVGAGTPVFNIVDDSRLIANVDLPVNLYLNKDKITGAEGSVPGISSPISLQTISFTPDPDNNMLYHMKLSVPTNVANELSPGVNIAVSIITCDDDNPGLLIPSRAIISDKGKYYVWVYNNPDSTINKKEIRLDGKPIGRMTVVEGLTGSDEIVETGVRQFYEGEKVNVLNRQETGI